MNKERRETSNDRLSKSDTENQRWFYCTAIEELTKRVDNASVAKRVRLKKQLTKIQGQDTELLKNKEKVRHLVDQVISIDLDDGVKLNYAIFEDVLAPIKQACSLKNRE